MNCSISDLPILGVDVGGTKILTALVDRNGAVLSARQTAMHRQSTQSTLDSIRAAVAEFIGAAGRNGRFGAIGFGLVGRTDPARGLWVRADNLPVKAPIALAQEMERQYHVPAFLDNDVLSAATAELCFGVGRRYQDFLLINVGTGLSAGIVSEGRLLRGAGNVAGEIGRTTLGLRDWGRGMLEDWCSGGGLQSRCADTPWRTTRELFAAAENGNTTALALVNSAVEALAEATACLVSIFDPSAIVLAGSVACNPYVRGILERTVRDRAFHSSLRDLKQIMLSELPQGQVGVIGAAQSARLRLMNSNETK